MPASTFQIGGLESVSAVVMYKRISILLLVLIGMFAGVYYLRVQIVTNLFNSVLKDSDLHIIQLDSLVVGWRGLAINKLVLSVDKLKTPQTLNGLMLSYDLLEVRPEHLTIDSASLTLPPDSGEKPTAPLLLTGLAQQLSSAPLESLRVRILEVSGSDMPLVQQPLSLSADLDSGALDLEISDDKGLRLDLVVDNSSDKQTAAQLQLISIDQNLIGLQLHLAPEEGRLNLTGSGQLDAGALATFGAPLVSLPDAVEHVDGVIPFQLEALFGDDLNAVGEIHGNLSLPTGTRLEMDLTALSEQLQAVQLALELTEKVLITGTRAESGDTQLTLAGKAITFRAEEPRGSLAGNLTGLHCDFRDMLTCRGGLEIRGDMPELVLAGEQTISLGGLEIHLLSEFDLHDQALSLHWDPGRLLYLDRLQQGELRLNNLGLLANAGGTLNYRLDEERLSLVAGSIDILLPRASLADLNAATRLTLSELTLTIGTDTQAMAGAHLATDGINLQRQGGWLPALALESDISFRANQLLAAGTLHSDQGKSLLNFSALQDLAKGKGSADLSSEGVSFDAVNNRLSRFFSHWPFEFDIYEGEASLRGEFDWYETEDQFYLHGALDHSLDNLAGIYGELGFIGLSADIPLAISPPHRLHTRNDALLTIEQVDVGVPVEAVTARFRLDVAEQELNIKAFEARLFDGRIWTENAVYRADSPSNRIDIGVDGLQLDQLLALAGYDAVEGSGSISGLLPLDIGTAGITMHRGMLAAKAPGGVFRYRAEVSPGTNPAMAQAMEALSNYHYSVFQCEADYLENGDLELNMTLRGHNPDMDQARPIHLNMNVTDNIPMLLKSLQSGRVIADIVSKKVGK